MNLNSNKVISIPEGVKFIRLSIRILGIGSFSISNISINNIGYWISRDMNIPERKRWGDFKNRLYLDSSLLLGWEKSKSLTYFPQGDFFQSELKGKQFSYLFPQNLITEAAFQLNSFKRECTTIFPSVDSKGDVQLSLILLGYRNGKNIEMHEIAFNQMKDIQFKENLDQIKAIIKVLGNGFFKDITIAVNTAPIKVINSLRLSLNPKDWHPANEKVTLESKTTNSLIGKSEIDSGLIAYMSYKENNNSFNLLPINHLLTIKQGYEYECLIESDYEEGMTIEPMFVGYSKDKKIQVLQLKLNSKTIVKPQKEVNQFRVALRFSGKGNFKVNNITINEVDP